MKLLCSILFSFIFISLNAQKAPEITPDGGGEFVFETTEDKCLSATDRIAIQKKIKKNIEGLKKNGKYREPSQKMLVNFEWPLQKNSGLSFNNCFAISNFVDQDPGAGILDHNCTDRTYDGHNGMDIFTWPFPWYLVENDYAEVIAGADGVIVGKSDGHDDDHCACIGTWNAVYVQHSDGSIAWYGHMKKNSLSSKIVGESVNKGDFLGIVASSGCSTGPHLHFEVHDDLGNIIDPYTGTCNSLNNSSWWSASASQAAYRVPTVNALLTHDAVPDHGCPGVNESPNMQNAFAPGDLIYFATYYRDRSSGDVSTYTLRKPNGSVWNSWTQTATSTFNASWWYWSFNLPPSGPYGNWAFEVECYGQTVSHPFLYSDAISVDELNLSNPVLLKITDLLGREAKPDSKNPYLYYYSDGSVKKMIVGE